MLSKKMEKVVSTATFVIVLILFIVAVVTMVKYSSYSNTNIITVESIFNDSLKSNKCYYHSICKSPFHSLLEPYK